MRSGRARCPVGGTARTLRRVNAGRDRRGARRCRRQCSTAGAARLPMAAPQRHGSLQRPPPGPRTISRRLDRQARVSIRRRRIRFTNPVSRDRVGRCWSARSAAVSVARNAASDADCECSSRRCAASFLAMSTMVVGMAVARDAMMGVGLSGMILRFKMHLRTSARASAGPSGGAEDSPRISLPGSRACSRRWNVIMISARSVRRDHDFAPAVEAHEAAEEQASIELEEAEHRL